MKKRLLRITWNDNLWEVPSGHKWSKKNQGDSDKAFENKFGFGGEEWLFNTLYNIDGFQYGYIRGLMEVSSESYIDEAYLFSIHPQTKDRLLIGIIRNVEVLDPGNLSKKVLKTFDAHHKDKIEQLKDVGADYTGFEFKELNPIVRFKMEDASVFDRPLLINQLKAGRKYNRFKPYKITSDLQQLLSDCIKLKPFVFLPGTRLITKNGHERTSKPHTKNIIGVHNQITKKLEAFLAPEFTVKKNNLSIERTVFGDNIADVVLKNKDGSFSIIEVKTSNNTRYNIREALGQLIDYASWYEDITIKELIIISPSSIADNHKTYFKRIQTSIKSKLKYWQYNADRKALDSFIKY